jgi:hypothetical protein
MAAGKRYKFQGSQLLVGTGYGAQVEITGISKADPAVVTATGHGRAEGDVVLIDEVDGMTEVNDNLYVVEDPTATTFELAGVDSAGYTTFDTGSPQGARLSPVSFVNFCELTGINKQGGTSEEIEATTICSNAKEYEVGMPDAGTLQLDFNFAPNQAVQAYLRNAQTSGIDVAFKVVLPGDGGSIIILGNVQQTNWQAAVNGLWTGSVTVKLTGEEFVLPAA